MEPAHSRNHHASPLSLLLLVLWVAGPCAGSAPPAHFVSRGPGGGGAFFAPVINPANPDELWVSSDMGDLFHSTNFGDTWETVDFRVLQGGSQPGRMSFTPDPRIRYALDGDIPVRSADGGRTWIRIPPDPWSMSVYCLFVDPQSTNRLLVSDYSTLKSSTDSGASYTAVYTANDLLIAGVFWNGPNIHVGTRPGLLVSSDGGRSFSRDSSPGIPAGESMVSFAGAREGEASRFYCVTLGSGDVYPGVQGYDYSGYRGIYRLDPGIGSWKRITNGIAGNHPFFVATCPTNTRVVWVAGADSLGQPVVMRSVDAGDTWTQALRCTGNANVATGWTGDDPGPWNWKKWSFGECALGFAVSPTQPGRAVITDLGFIHVTSDGGATWRQAYCWRKDDQPPGTATPKATFHTGNGAEDTSCWSLTWVSDQKLFASYTDIRGMLSHDGGASWMSPPSLPYNSTYQTVRHPASGLLYAAMSSVHDLYAWDRYCQDTAIDGGSGEVMTSADQGLTWTRLRNFGRPVVALALDPARPDQLYAAVVHSATGGVYRTTNLTAGTAAAWTRLTPPPRTQGHPYNLAVLADGTLVATYSARISGGSFQPSSGVFMSTDDGLSWNDRTAPGMKYYTKDLTVDPHDPTQSRWYAGVWGEWGASAGLGGLYATTNRGLSWTRITSSLKAVSSCTVDPLAPDEMYVTTEDQGLWHCANRRDAAPAFTAVAGYPFRFPTRVFFNPYDSSEIWVTSYGNGLRLGRRTETRPGLRLRAGDHPGEVVIGCDAPLGMDVALTTSTNLSAWAPASELRMFGSPQEIPMSFGPGPGRFFRAELR